MLRNLIIYLTIFLVCGGITKCAWEDGYDVGHRIGMQDQFEIDETNVKNGVKITE